MRYIIEDKKYRFKSAFDTETGAYVRTGVLDENGKDTGAEPFMASYPHLIDVGIMGHCIHGKTGLCAKAGIGCYQSGMLVEQPNMSVEDFRWIAEQSKGRCNQFALGGRGDPDQHEYFEEILQICRENMLVPNFTTSGYGMTPEIAKLCKQYCGAVAVSWYRSEYTLKAIQMLLQAGVKTNIHYVLGNNSMDEAIETANEIASEHLEIVTKNPFETMTKIKNAGAIFLGEDSSEPLGDYFAGPNHVLPTNGTAKFFSPLSVDDFIKKSSVISYSYEALREVHKAIDVALQNLRNSHRFWPAAVQDDRARRQRFFAGSECVKRRLHFGGIFSCLQFQFDVDFRRREVVNLPDFDLFLFNGVFD